MRILLTNDDGVYAPGIRALREAFSAHDEFDTYLVAPERERSAMSHAITLHKPLHVKEIEFREGRGPVWAVNGTPADCTKLGILALVPDRPDIVISGINRGSNLGMDVLYSGTVSAAIEGYLTGVPSIAVSLDTHDEKSDFHQAAEFVVRFVRGIVSNGLSDPMLLNVNIPYTEAEPDTETGVPVGETNVETTYKVKLTTIGMRYYRSVFEPRQDPLGRTYYWLAGEVLDHDSSPDTDVGAVSKGFVSVTPMQFQLTDKNLLQKMESWIDFL